MRRDIREKIYIFLKMIELFIAFCIIVMIVILTAATLLDYVQGGGRPHYTDVLDQFLKEMLTFVVGIEFVKMLIFHNPERVVDVLIFAASRQMVVEHTNGTETIVWIIGIGLLFAIQKFLRPPSGAKHIENHESHEAHERENS